MWLVEAADHCQCCISNTIVTIVLCVACEPKWFCEQVAWLAMVSGADGEFIILVWMEFTSVVTVDWD